MSPITHIVAATDFSAPAEQAVRRGTLLAKQLGAKLHLLHVVHHVDLYCGPELSFGAQRHYEQMQLRASKVPLDNLAATLREQYGIPVQVTSRIGNTHMEVAKYAAANAGSLIVAGARGESESALLDILLGSTVTNLLRAATCSVLIVRNMVAEPYRQAIAAVDFSPGSAKVPALARTIAPDARIEALYIFDTNQEAHINKAGMDEALLQKCRDSAQAEVERRLDAMLAEQGSGELMTRQILSGYPSASICERAKVKQADLIVVGRHAKGGMEDWLLGSVSKGVAQAAGCDVLLCY